MKVNIPKLQGGGFATFTPIIHNVPVPQTSRDTGKNDNKNDSSSTDSSLLDDKIKDVLIKEGGLQNDVHALMQELYAIESSSPYAFTNQNNRISTINLISKVNLLRQNKEMWKKAISVAEGLGGYGEIAVGSSGEIFAYDKSGKLIATTVENYKKNKDELKILSFAELMTARNDDPQLTGKNSVFNAAGNAIGISKIVNHVTEVIKAFGSEELKETKYYTADFAKKITGKPASADEMNALKNLSNLLQNAPGDLHKVSITNSSERRNALKAVEYIWKTLGDASQKKLNAVAALNNVSDPRQLILDMIINQTDEKVETSVSPEKMPGEESASANAGKKPLSQFQMFFNNDLKGLWSDFMINDPKLSSYFRGTVASKGPLVNKNDTAIPMTTLYNILVDQQYNSMVDGSRISFGDKNITLEDARNIIYNPAEDAGVLFLPTNDSGNVDWEGIKRFNEANQVFEANKNNWSQKQTKEFFKAYNFDVNTSLKDGIIVLAASSHVKPFLVMSAYTNDAVESAVDDNTKLSRLEDRELETLKPYFNSIWTLGQGKGAKNLTPSNPWYHFGTPYYKSTVMIPIKPEASVMADALSGQGPTHKVEGIDDVKYHIKNSTTHSQSPLNPIISSTELTKQ